MKLFLPGILLLLTLSSYSANFDGDLRSFKQPDGSMVDVKLFGSEYYMRAEGLDAYTLIRDKESGWICYANLSSDQKNLVNTGIVYHGITGNASTWRNDLNIPLHLQISLDERRNLIRENQNRLSGGSTPDDVNTTPFNPVAGSITGLCIIIDFSDEPGTLPMTEYDLFCNDPTYSNFGNNGSLRTFYSDISGGLVDYQNVVFGYFRAPQTFAYYDGLPMGTGARQILSLALNWIASTGFDFSTLSLNPDQSIMAINMMYTGTPPTWGEGMWHHKGNYTGFSANGVHSNAYNCSPANSPLYISTICHENGHMIGKWPDTYKYDQSADGIGKFDLMCASGAPTNPVLPNPLFMDNVGWGQVIDLTNYVGMNYDTANSLISYRYSNVNDTNEFFLFQHRQKTGRSVAIPDEGLAIWHMDRNGDNQTTHHEVYLVHSNNDFGNVYSAAYKNPYVTEFSANTIPSSEWYDGSPSGLFVWGIDTPGVDVLPYHLGPGNGTPNLLLQYVDVTGDDNSNGFAESGETADLNIYIENNGLVNSSASILSAIATGANAGFVTINSNQVNMGPLIRWQPVTGSINITIDPLTPIGTVIDFEFTITDPLDTAITTASIVVGRQITMSNGATNSCSAIFYDVGALNNYNNGSNYTKTITPSTANNYMVADFVSFDLETDSACSNDYLEIYNGPTTSSPLMGVYCGTNSPGHVQASDPSGALTFKFHSNSSVTAPGWEAYLSCSATPGVPEYDRPQINLFPNPTDGLITVNSENLQILNVTDALGQRVSARINETGNSLRLDLTELSDGIYFMNYKYQNMVYSEMVVKK
jgi:M6 family metalloprotease-like protein